jgi:putative PIG3 family NAD(P)H quinone oxidoreductase
MWAVRFDGSGGPDVVRWGELPDPVPGRGEGLGRVHASALNRADLLQRRGLYAPPAGTRPDVPGLELAGEVVRAGEGVEAWRPGDRVMAICAGEGQAELAVVHERMLLPVPEGLSLEQAAALPEAGITAHDALFTLGGLRPGWPVLVHAAGSGVGTVAVKLAKAAGATVLGTARSAEKLERARALGLDHGLLVAREAPRFADEVRRLTGGHGCPLVLDLVGAAYAVENLAALALRGVLVVVGTMGGADAAIDYRTLLQRRASIVGTTLRMRPLEEKIAATRVFARDVLPLVAAGRVRPVVDEVLPAERAREAHERMERNASFGKLVLRFQGGGDRDTGVVRGEAPR